MLPVVFVKYSSVHCFLSNREKILVEKETQTKT